MKLKIMEMSPRELNIEASKLLGWRTIESGPPIVNSYETPDYFWVGPNPFHMEDGTCCSCKDSSKLPPFSTNSKLAVALIQWWYRKDPLHREWFVSTHYGTTTARAIVHKGKWTTRLWESRLFYLWKKFIGKPVVKRLKTNEIVLVCFGCSDADPDRRHDFERSIVRAVIAMTEQGYD